jgi:predicted O-linked N-acetylglucosamine transferase (SPINDLY family)
VFACFTNASRITRDVFGLWLEILRAVPGSVLWLQRADAATVHNLRSEAQRGGVDAARLVFAQRVADKAGHIARLALADLALDTIGWHNGHTTTNDMLWAGVPVLTAPGRSFASRVGASLVTAAGLPELVARDGRDYVNIAIGLGTDRGRCAALKSNLVANRQHAPFFDGRGIVGGLEDVYFEMWRQYCSGAPLQPIGIR